jgi:hypothetical protein
MDPEERKLEARQKKVRATNNFETVCNGCYNVIS